MPCCAECDRCCASFCIVAGPLLSIVVAWCIFWNATKLPFYWPDENLPMTSSTYNATACSTPQSAGGPSPTVCHGMEASPNLHWLIGYRSAKVRSSPSLFLVPHVCMGVTLLGTLVLVLLEPKTILSRSYFFLPLAMLFSFHVIPEEGGIPDPQMGGFHMNAVFIAFIWIGVLISVAGVALLRKGTGERETGAPDFHLWHRSTGRRTLVAGWVIISTALLMAPVFEFDLIGDAFKGVNPIWGGYDANLSKWMPAPWQGNVPDPLSGRGPYATSGCPAAIGWLYGMTLLLAGISYCAVYSSRKVRNRRSVKEIGARGLIEDAVSDPASQHASRPPTKARGDGILTEYTDAAHPL